VVGSTPGADQLAGTPGPAPEQLTAAHCAKLATCKSSPR
jgi:hypothetical protein